VIVALMAQSLTMFMATQQSLIDATTKVWPEGVEVWPSIVVLIFNLAIMIFAFGTSSQDLFNGSHGGGILLEVPFREKNGQSLYDSPPHLNDLHNRNLNHQFNFIKIPSYFRPSSLKSVLSPRRKHTPLRPQNNLSISRNPLSRSH
jgi:hypothetical protein